MERKGLLIFYVCVLMFSLLSKVSAKDEQDYEKKETVRVQCDENGSVNQINVEDFLKLNNQKESLIDVSKLQQIKNIEGDEEYTYQSDGTVVWENHNNNIFYKGEADLPLPVEVKVSYFLDGKPMSAKDLLGKSGKLKIRFDYINNTNQAVTVNHKKINVHVPFLCTSVLILPYDNFKNVEISHGKILEDKNQTVAIGMAFPGIKEDLQLEKYKLTKNVDISDYVEMTADVQDFELELTATFVSTIGINEIDELSQLYSMINSAKLLTSTSQKLLSTSQQLNKGMSSMNQYLYQYFNGIVHLDQGIQTIESSLQLLKTQKKPLDQNLKDINNKLKKLKIYFHNSSLTQEQKDYMNAIVSLVKDLKILQEEVSTSKEDIDKLRVFLKSVSNYKKEIKYSQSTMIDELNKINLKQVEDKASVQAKEKVIDIINQSSLTNEQKKELFKNIDNVKITNITNDLKTSLQSIKQTVNDIPILDFSCLDSIDLPKIKTLLENIDKQENILSQYSSVFDQYGDIDDIFEGLSSKIDEVLSFTDSIKNLSSSIDQLENKMRVLNKGSHSLVEQQKYLKNGMIKLMNGMSQWFNGYKKFDVTGIQKLGNLAGDDLKNIIERFQAIQKAESEYYNYSGISQDVQGSVIFIYETDKIKK